MLNNDGLFVSFWSLGLNKIIPWVNHEITTGCSSSQNYSSGWVGLAKKALGRVLTQPIPMKSYRHHFLLILLALYRNCSSAKPLVLRIEE